jgi:hypothetical protein
MTAAAATWTAMGRRMQRNQTWMATARQTDAADPDMDGDGTPATRRTLALDVILSF